MHSLLHLELATAIASERKRQAITRARPPGETRGWTAPRLTTDTATISGEKPRVSLRRVTTACRSIVDAIHPGVPSSTP